MGLESTQAEHQGEVLLIQNGERKACRKRYLNWIAVGRMSTGI